MMPSAHYLAGSLVLISGTLGAGSVAANPAVAAPPSASPERSPATLMAQADTCRQVSANIPGLNVRQAPGTNSAIVGVVPGGQTVEIENLGLEGWVPVSEPMAGYVSSRYLTRCAGFTEPVAATPVGTPSGDQCRQVVVSSGLNVRVEPDRYSNRLATLSMGTNVELADSETEHWTMISVPVEGYVAKRFLGSCN